MVGVNEESAISGLLYARSIDRRAAKDP